MYHLKDKVVIVTGAGGGLGKAFAQAFATEGAKVAIVDINEEAAQQTSVEIQGSIAVKADVTSEESLKVMTQKVIDEFGRLDVLINNAAIYAGIQRKPFFELSEKEWDLVMNVNLKGTWMASKAVFPFMKSQGGGKIINISSATVMSGSPQWSHYVASKGGVIGLTRSMAREIGDFNINVNNIAPGFTLTEASLSLMDNAKEYGVQRGAIKRGSNANDIVGTALYLASKASDFVTGQTIVVDGGKQFI